MDPGRSPAGPAGSAKPTELDINNTNSVSYNRSSTTVNQTPSTLLLFDNPGAAAVPDVPPPSYEEAIGISPKVASSAEAASAAPAHAAAPQAQPAQQRRGTGPPAPAPGFDRPNNSTLLAVPGTRPRPASFTGVATPAAGGLAPTTPTYSQHGVPPPPAYGPGDQKGLLPPQHQQPLAAPLLVRPSTSTSAAAANAAGSAGSANNGRNRIVPAPPGSVPTGRQFPPIFNLYGDRWSRNYMLGEHQDSPLYAVRMQVSWKMQNPVVALHNGPDPNRAPLLAAVHYLPLSDNMSVTLPPPLTYRGGPTAVPLEIEVGWSRLYRFTMEVGTDPQNVRQEHFEWRHSFGNAIAALGGARDGWKLVRLSTQAPPGGQPPRPAPGFMTSDGREVVAVYSGAQMSLTKQLKFAFVGTGRSGALGERWAVMAVASALAIWEKEEASQNRR
ncbi:hypothetical protein SPI_07779 [Niveomyces insectorum RCEF 264]|uniref:Uncharacterized protein n=1 Tax=Niveomyces insectorum RCEF 264 TaxID=1081102 RepID=A0A167P0Z3_9HYPO|nr:hypothetical protein SPI_07779 [Niveomyces insectorum RCEF 264]